MLEISIDIFQHQKLAPMEDNESSDDDIPEDPGKVCFFFFQCFGNLISLK